MIDDDSPGSQSLDVIDALSRLKEYSFIRVEVKRGKRTYEIHKLVQDAARYGPHMRSLASS